MKIFKYLPYIIAPAVALSPLVALAEIEEIIVTANKREQSIQDVSTSITALDEAAIERAGIIDITGLETVVPGLRIGASGGEVRPALRGARTNDVGVAGPGIAEQVVGIFQDGIYTPTTTAGLGAYADIKRIEVLRGPQGTLYGRNTFAGSINVISNGPDFEELSGSFKALRGDYDRTNYEAVLNVPVTDSFATRLVAVSDKHNGIIENLHTSSSSDDLRERNRFYLRSTNEYRFSDDLSAVLRFDYSQKDSNSEAIWGYQQIAGYSITETSGSTPMNRIYNPQATVTRGHIYQPADAQNDDLGPYEVYRNAVSIDKQETYSTSLVLDWSGLYFADTKFTFNYSELKGRQFYDNDYSDGGFDFVGGFGREDDQRTYSAELQLTSNNDGPLDWVGGLYYFDQEAKWGWLWRADTDGNMTPDSIVVPSWGAAGLSDPHTADSIAVYGQATYSVMDRFRVIGGLRYNRDSKEFTGNIPDWSDNAVLWKAALEYDVTDDMLAYFNIATGYRTGGANDQRVIDRGAPGQYDNEDVTSYDFGLKNTLLNGTMTLNFSGFFNTYEDVKAQLFAVACRDTMFGVDDCASMGSSLLTFEYYENGGDVDSHGLELEMLWSPVNELLVNASFTYLNSEFDDNYAVGNPQLRPLLGLGNFEGRQDVNDPNSRFSFAGWTPALAPEFTFGLGGAYDFHLNSSKLGRSVLTPSIQLKYVDDYYAFDVNIPETLQDSHVISDARLTWSLKEDTVRAEIFVMNMFDEEVLTRAVVHSQLVGGLPINSVQANWNNPRTFGASLRYAF